MNENDSSHKYIGGNPVPAKLAGYCSVHQTWEKIEKGTLYLWKKDRGWVVFKVE